MKIIITKNTAISGKSIAADMDKVVTVSDQDGRDLIIAGKARQIVTITSAPSKPAAKKSK